MAKRRATRISQTPPAEPETPSEDAGYVCPYTGNKMELVFDENLKHTGYYFKGGFDPAIPFLNMVSASAALLMRNGKHARLKTLSCPYTGAPVKVVEKNGLWHVVGDYFSPSKHWDFKEDAIYAVSMRDGEVPEGIRPAPRVEARVVEEPGADPTVGLGGDPGGYVQEAFERVTSEELKR